MTDKNKPKRTRAKTSVKAIDGVSAAELAGRLEGTQLGSKFHTKGGAGFAAEDANSLADKLRLRRVEKVGLNNARNGADRIVDGVAVQTKYFAAASETVRAAFDPNTGVYRYPSQVLEVPNDQYEECLALMRRKVAEGKVPNVNNPDDVEAILKQGNVTYKQARNIARAGNVDSLVYDAKTQAVTSSYLFGISFVVDFGQRVRSGQEARAAVNDALMAACVTGSRSLLTGVVASQLLRTHAAAASTVVVRGGIRGIYSTSMGKSLIEGVAAGSLGKAVYGAAALNHVSKLLRSNFITSTVMTVVVTTPDFYRAVFARSISWNQFTKNLLMTVAQTAGGVGGWMAGAAAGAAIGSLVPFVGTMAGGFIGGLAGAFVGGSAASQAAKSGLDQLIEDDAERMLVLVEKTSEAAACDHLLLESEIPTLVDFIKRTVTPSWLRNMYQAGASPHGSEGSARYAYDSFAAECHRVLTKRTPVHLPPPEQVTLEIGLFVERIAPELEDTVLKG